MIPFRAFDAICLSIAVIVGLNAISTTAAVSELKLVNVVFRHGDRTPVKQEMYPNDPYVNYSFYPTGLGQLTLEGKKREYRLGRALRSRYNTYLGSLYVPKHVEARSTDYDRTKMSLQLVLAGLFQPGNFQRWHNRLNWQPVPTSYIPRVDDNILLSDQCPEYIDELERVLNSLEVQQRLNQFQDLMSDLTKLSGRKIKEFYDMFALYHTFVAETNLRLPLPEWAYNYFPYGQLFDGVVAHYETSSNNTLLKKLFGGPLIRTMTENMIAKQRPIGPSETKIYLYGGHESNIAALLSAFDLFQPHIPQYSSAIILELHKINEKYYVKLLYYLGIPPNLKELVIPGCESVLCPFDKFLEVTSSLIPSDEELICDKRRTPDFADVKYPAAVQQIMLNKLKKQLLPRNANDVSSLF